MSLSTVQSNSICRVWRGGPSSGEQLSSAGLALCCAALQIGGIGPQGLRLAVLQAQCSRLGGEICGSRHFMSTSSLIPDH